MARVGIMLDRNVDMSAGPVRASGIEKTPLTGEPEESFIITHGGEGETCAWASFRREGYERGERRVHAGDGAAESSKVVKRQREV
jgi:hypothetical protein